MTEAVNRILRAKATEWGWRLLLMVLTTIIGIMVAQGNAIQAAKDESANRRISGVEAAISDLLDLREQVALLNDQMARGRALREAFEARTDSKLDGLREDVSGLTTSIAVLSATINQMVRGTPGPPPTSLSVPGGMP